MRPQSIPEVLNALDLIIARAIAEEDAGGLFAYLYRRTTAEIARGIARGDFEDGPRMEAFDVVFANLYLDAHAQWKSGRAVPGCWALAFEQAAKPLALAQHLLLGMNAHINYDLALAGSTFMKGKPLYALKTDFDRVNLILASLVNEIQERLNRVSPLLFLLDWLANDKDEALLGFSMAKARSFSWQLAVELWPLQGAALEQRLQQADRTVVNIGQSIASPKGFLFRKALWLVRSFENQPMGEAIAQIKA